MKAKLNTSKILTSVLIALFVLSVYHSNSNTEPGDGYSLSLVHATPRYVSSSSDLQWFTYVEVLVTGKAGSGDTPIDLTLEIYDNGVFIIGRSDTGVSLGPGYTVALVLGSDNGNAAGRNLGEHTLQGRMTLSNAKGSVSYDTESITIGIGQVPVGEVT